MSHTPDELDKLPVGANYQAQEGNAKVIVEKKPDGSLEFTANCDSLTILVTNLEKEVYHLNKENTALKTNLKEQKTVVEKEPSGWQWFQIWGFRLLVLFFVGRYLIKKYITKKQ